MSRENVEVVRLANEPHNGEDMGPILRQFVEGLHDWAGTEAVAGPRGRGPSSRWRPGVVAMSQENVEIVRRLNAAFNCGDVAGFLELLDPACEWWDREDDPGATVHRGHDGISAFLAELGAHAELRVEL